MDAPTPAASSFLQPSAAVCVSDMDSSFFISPGFFSYRKACLLQINIQDTSGWPIEKHMLMTISGLKCTLPVAFTYEASFPEERSDRGQNPDPLKENGNLVTYFNRTKFHRGFVSWGFLLPFVSPYWNVLVSELHRSYLNLSKAIRGTFNSHDQIPLQKVRRLSPS